MSRLGTRTTIGVHIATASTIYVANEVLRTWIELVGLRGLDNRYITSNLRVISIGLQTWATTRHLQKAILEVFDDKVVERWDMSFTYDIAGKGEPSQFRTEMQKLKEFASRLSKLPQGCKYRVVVELGEGAPPVEGWEPTSLRSIEHLSKQNLGGYIDTAKIKVCMEYWGQM